MPVDHFGDEVARDYDDDEAERFSSAELDPTVDLLADLAGDGPVLELGIGTGRVALPLTARGVVVHGIDLSTAMVAQLRAKPGGAGIPVTIGDFATTRVDVQCSLVYLVFNTINNLVTQDEQVACFCNAASHLRPGGRFLVEVGVPRLRGLGPGESLRPFSMTEDHVGVDEYDLPTQGLVSHHFTRRGEHWERVSMPFRYVWPAELDLMARIAGLELEHRWADWRRQPFSAESRRHVSVWRRRV